MTSLRFIQALMSALVPPPGRWSGVESDREQACRNGPDESIGLRERPWSFPHKLRTMEVLLQPVVSWKLLWCWFCSAVYSRSTRCRFFVNGCSFCCWCFFNDETVLLRAKELYSIVQSRCWQAFEDKLAGHKWCAPRRFVMLPNLHCCFISKNPTAHNWCLQKIPKC